MTTEPHYSRTENLHAVFDSAVKAPSSGDIWLAVDPGLNGYFWPQEKFAETCVLTSAHKKSVDTLYETMNNMAWMAHVEPLMMSDDSSLFLSSYERKFVLSHYFNLYVAGIEQPFSCLLDTTTFKGNANAIATEIRFLTPASSGHACPLWEDIPLPSIFGGLNSEDVIRHLREGIMQLAVERGTPVMKEALSTPRFGK